MKELNYVTQRRGSMCQKNEERQSDEGTLLIFTVKTIICSYIIHSTFLYFVKPELVGVALNDDMRLLCAYGKLNLVPFLFFSFLLKSSSCGKFR